MRSTNRCSTNGGRAIISSLNVNWRRRLTRVAAVLLALTALVTIPLALFAWQQKTQAEYQARQAGLQRGEAERQRDEAQRQRQIAEQSLRDTTAALATAQQALDELRRSIRRPRRRSRHKSTGRARMSMP